MAIDPKIQTSFIPRKPIVSDGISQRTPVNFVSVIIFTIFLTSIALTAGVYVYKYYLEKQITSLQVEFEKSKKSFDQTFIDEVSRLSQRMDASKDILKNHISASSIFDLLQRNTLQTVSFSSFTYSKDDLGNIKVSMSGVAKNYSAVALQSDAFVEQISCIKNPVFSGLSLDQRGNVSFKFDAVLDPRVVTYSKNLGGSFCQTVSQPNNQPNVSASSTNKQN